MKYLKKFNENTFVPKDIEKDEIPKASRLMVDFFRMMKSNGDISDIEKVMSEYLSSSGDRLIQLYALAAEFGRVDVLSLIQSMTDFNESKYNEHAKKWLINSPKFKILSDDVKNSVIDIIGELSESVPYSNDDTPYTGEK